MPISKDEFAKLEKVSDRTGGKKVDWEKIATEIVDSGLFYSVKEVHQNLVEKAVTPVRCRGALETLVKAGQLSKRFDGRKWYYGEPIAD